MKLKKLLKGRSNIYVATLLPRYSLATLAKLEHGRADHEKYFFDCYTFILSSASFTYKKE
jgi:hypothetical protein